MNRPLFRACLTLVRELLVIAALITLIVVLAEGGIIVVRIG